MKPAVNAGLSAICLMYIGVSFVWNKKKFRHYLFSSVLQLGMIQQIRRD